jgi:putative DNA primase/helicase
VNHDGQIDATLDRFTEALDASLDDPAASTTPTIHRPFPRTDSGNAEYFAALHGADVRRDHARGRWLLWREHRFQPDADGHIRRLAKLAMRLRFRDAADLDDREECAKEARWALSSESRAKIDALLYLAQSEHPIADTGQNWDADISLLAVPNGVIELPTGTLRAGRRSDRITMSAAVPFDPKATCPRWEQFISEVFGGDGALVGFAHRGVGYSISGETGEQCIFICHGGGSNGKGTFVNTLQKHVLGDYAHTLPFSAIELHQRSSIPNDLATLVGRRFVVASETNDGIRLNEARVKALTGCDPISARFLHAEFFTFRPVAKFWLTVNHKPIVRDDSHGFWRRMRLIPFQQRFSINQTLENDLKAEASGILTWAVRGYQAWREQGLNPPAVVTEATREYEHDSDQLAGFLEEAVDVDDAAEVSASDLYRHYRLWAEQHGLSPREQLTATMFGRKCAERLRRSKTRDGAVYHGVARRIPVTSSGQ